MWERQSRFGRGAETPQTGPGGGGSPSEPGGNQRKLTGLSTEHGRARSWHRLQQKDTRCNQQREKAPGRSPKEARSKRPGVAPVESHRPFQFLRQHVVTSLIKCCLQGKLAGDSLPKPVAGDGSRRHPPRPARVSNSRFLPSVTPSTRTARAQRAILVTSSGNAGDLEIRLLILVTRASRASRFPKESGLHLLC